MWRRVKKKKEEKQSPRDSRIPDGSVRLKRLPKSRETSASQGTGFETKQMIAGSSHASLFHQTRTCYEVIDEPRPTTHVPFPSGGVEPRVPLPISFCHDSPPDQLPVSLDLFLAVGVFKDIPTRCTFPRCGRSC